MTVRRPARLLACLASVAVALLGPAAISPLAHAAPLPPLPSAGSELQQLTPVPQAVPKAAPDLPGRTEPAPAPAAAAGEDTIRIRVHALRISGNRQFDAATLLQAAGFVADQDYTLAGLRELAANVTRFYRQQGFFVAKAVLPAQDIAQQEVRLQVIEGQFGRIRLHNTSAVQDITALGVLGAVQPDSAITLAPLERGLLLLNDLPGVTARGTLAPGEVAGTSDLLLEVAPAPRLSGLVDADNQGSRSTGSRRVGAALTVNELTGLGDTANLRVQQAIHGLTYVRGGYQLQALQARLGVAYTDVQYRLGDAFEALQAHGSATVASLYATYPLVRTRDTNLNLQVGWDRKTFHDQVDSVTSTTDKAARVWTTTLSAVTQDELLGLGYDSATLAWTRGQLDILTPASLAADLRNGRTSGQYDKALLSASRQQWLGSAGLLYLGASGQWANHNLDASEKFSLGGADGLRAYPPGEANGDQGVLLTAEFRRPLDLPFHAPGQLQGSLFVDSGRTWLVQEPYSAGSNVRNLSDLGVGLNWSVAGLYQVKLSVAHKLGAQRATSAPDAAVRAYIQGVYFF